MTKRLIRTNWRMEGSGLYTEICVPGYSPIAEHVAREDAEMIVERVNNYPIVVEALRTIAASRKNGSSTAIKVLKSLGLCE